MVILDTSVWIDFFRARRPCFDHVSELLERNEVVALSPVFGELLQGAKTNRERTIIMDFWVNLPKVAEPELFIRAGTESGRRKWLDKGVGLIDAVIVTAARETSSFVWTQDKKLSGLLKREERFVVPFSRQKG